VVVHAVVCIVATIVLQIDLFVFDFNVLLLTEQISIAKKPLKK
jgi:hypothetical protein